MALPGAAIDERVRYQGMSDELDWIRLSGRRAKGKRPEFFDEPAIDQLFAMVLALVSEVSVVRERLDTVERLLDTSGMLNRSLIEGYRPDAAAGHERGLATQAYISRVMRIFQQQVEALQAADPPVDDWVEQLSRE